MSLQEIFDKAYIGLLKQGFRRSLSDIATYYDNEATEPICAYRGAGGMRCAIGHLIPDENYDPRLESTSARHTSILKAANLDTRNIDVRKLAVELQEAHDLGVTPFAMRDRLHLVAKQFNLTIPDANR